MTPPGPDPRTSAALTTPAAPSAAPREHRNELAGAVEVLEREADAARDPAQAAELYLRLGRLHEERLLRRDRAALYYLRALRLDPTLAAARQASLRCLLALRRFGQAKRTLDEARALGEEPRTLAAEYARLGGLLSDEPLEHGLAMEALVEALALDRAAPGAVAALGKIKASPRAWRGDAKALLEQAAQAKERRTAAQLTLRVAALHAAYDPDGLPRAVELVERALLLAPAVRHGLELLERAFGERGDWRGLATALARLSESVRDRAAVAELQLRLAQLELTRFGDAAEAAAALDRVLALDPASEPAAQQAFELHLEAGRQVEALSVLERHLAAAPERAEHAPWRLGAAGIALALGDRPRARAHLEAARRADPRSRQVAAALAPLLEDAGEWRLLAGAIETLAQGEPDPSRRAQLLERLARLELEQLAAPRDALRRLAEALRLDPGRATLRKAIDAAAARADLFPELARAYRGAADGAAADPAARKVLLRRAAEVWDRDLGLPEQAVEAWRALVAQDPQDVGARAALDACLVRSGRLSEVADDLRRRIAAAAPPDRRELTVRLARSHEQAGDAAGAAQAWREVLAGGDEPAALRGLADALAALATPGTAEVEERAAVLGRLAERLAGAERAEAALDRALLLAGPLARPAEAAPLLCGLPAGALPAARQPEAVAALEALLERGVEATAVAQVLARVYAAQGVPAKQAAALELLAGSMPAGEAAARAAVFLEAAELRLARLGDARGALSAAAAALRAHPVNADARAACERLARETGAVRELYALLVEAAGQLAAQPEEELPLRALAARLAEEELGDLEGATAQLRRTLALAPDDAAALEALCRVALAAERWDEAAELLRERGRRAAGEARSALLAELAELLRARRGDPAGAASALRDAIALAPAGSQPALRQRLAAALAQSGDASAAGEELAAAAEAEGDPRRLLAALQELASQAATPAARAAAERRQAEVWGPRLGQWSLAFAALARAARATPGDVALRAELRAAAARAGADADAVRAYQALLPALPPAEAAPAWRELAALFEERLADGERALAAWAEALRLEPGDPGTLRALARLHRAAGHERERADACLALAARAAGSTEALAAWREAAEALDALDDAPRAAQAWAEVSRLAPDDPPAAAALERLLARLDRPAELTELLERRRARPGQARDLDLAFRLAGLRRRLGAPEAALALLREVLDVDPGHLPARGALVELAAAPGALGREAFDLADPLLRASGEHAARALLRERRLATVTDPAERAVLHAAIRELHERELGKPELALAAASRALAEGGPVAAAAEPELRRLAQLIGRPDCLSQAYEAAAGFARGELELALRRRAAQAREGEPGDAAGAVAAWQRVREAAPDDPDALAALQRLFVRMGDARQLAEVALRRIAAASGSGRAALLVELSEQQASLGQVESATATAEDAFAADPACDAALELLSRLHRGAGRRESVARVLAAQAGRAHGDAARRLDLLAERALLLEEDRDGRPALEAWAEILAESRQEPRAVTGLDRLLARPETRDAAGRILEDVHRARGDARRLVALLEARLDTADRAERAPLLAEVAALHDRLGDRGRAFLVRARAVVEVVAPGEDDPALRADLERLAAAAGAFAELAETYEQALARGLPPSARVEVLRRLAGLYADRLARPDLAARALEALAAETSDPEPLGALVRLHRARGAWRELANALHRQSERSSSPEARKELLFEVAQVMEDHLADQEGAMDAYRQILTIDPEDPNALRLLGKVLGGAERWEELVEVLGREVVAAEKRPNLVAEAAELRFRLGRIRQQRLADVPGALQCYQSVLDKVPRHPAALAALEELARTGGTGAVEAATLLEPIYEHEGEHQKLVEALTARAKAAPDARSRGPLLRRAAEVQAGPLRNPELAFLTAARAVREDPDAAESLALAGRLAEANGLTDELAALIAEVADRAQDAPARAELRRRVAHLTARGGDPRASAEAWSRLLELAPDDAEALSGLAAAHRTAGNAEALGQVLRRRVAVEEDPAARPALLAELAGVQEQQKDLPGAIATLRRLLELEPGRREALGRLDRLCVATEKWVELADVLAREVAAAQAAGDAAGALGFRQRLAELKETRLLDKDGALALYEEVLAARPDHPGALERLEGLLAKDPASVRAAAALERAYAATGAWARYAAVLEMRAGERPDPVERKALFLELAEVRERRLQNPELAFVALCRAFREDPADPALRAEVSRLALATEHAEELAAVFEDEFARVPPGADAEVALTLGTLYEERLAAPEAAARWYEEARRRDPAGAPRALAGLDRIYRATAQHAPLADVLEAEAGQAAPGDRAALLFRLGQLCEEELSDGDRAVRAYEALLELDPRHSAALRALDGLYEADGRLEALAENLAAQRDLVTDAGAHGRLTARLAAVVQQLGRDEEAVALWREALGHDPRHEAALAALEVLLEKLQRWPELGELLRARLAITADRREATRLHEKLGALLATKLGDPAQAVTSYQALLDADPRHRGALEALRGLFAAQSDLEGLAGVFRRLVPLQEDAAGVKATRLALADVLLRAGKKGEAAEQGRRALELEPHVEGELARMAGIFEAAGSAQDRVKAIETRAALLASAGRSEEAVEAWIAAADAWERPLGKPDAAAAALEKVLEAVPDRKDAWVRLRELYARAGDWRAWVRVSDLFTTHLVDPAERLTVLKEVGEVHEKRLGQKEMAFITWCRAFSEDSADPTVQAAVQRLAADAQAWDELAAVYEQVSEDARGLAKARLLLELGRVKDLRLDDADGAEAAFRRALEVDPASPEALDALTELFTRRGRVRDLVIALEQKLEAAAGLEEKKATLLEMARIYDGQLQDREEAISALKRVLELDGADATALAAIAALYRREQRFADLAGILARARDLAQDGAARVAYQLQIAALHENELADDEAAVEAYRAALGLDDTNRDALSGLERLYTKLDRFAELNRVYERQAELATEPREKVRILGKSAAIWQEKLSDPARAIEKNEAVLSLDGQNLAAARNLETLYRREGAWEKLIAVLQHHASLTQDRRELVSLTVQVGDVWSKELGRADRAEAMYAGALQQDPDSREAISALARLYEKSGNWNLAVEMLQREVKLAQGGEAVVDLQSRIGRIQEEMLQDRGGAKLAFARALDADAGHLPSLRALRAIAEAERDRDAYLRYLLAEARYVEGDDEKATLLHQAGRIHQEERDDPDGAARLYEEALRKVADFLPAARPLADLYVARADWARADAVLEVVVKRLEQEGEAKELCRQSYRLGYVAEKLGRREQALQSYRRAYELDATYLPALEGLGHLLVQDGAWEEALKIFQAILIHHRDGLTDLEVVETYWQIGELQGRLGQGDRAGKSLEKALEIDAGHEPSRRALVALLEAAGDWERSVDHRQKLAAAQEGAAKLETLMAIGATSRDKLQDPYQAIDAFTAAARLDPGNVQVTEALLGLYRDTRQGQKAADVLARLLETPEAKADPQRAARLHHALAVTLRDELKDEAGAARELDAALDADPRQVQAFADLEALLTAAQRWRELEQAYVRMIQRLSRGPEAAAARVALWKTLAELYRRVLSDPENARMAYEVVVKADPNDTAALQALAELSAHAGGHGQDAIDAQRRLLALGTAPQRAVSAMIGLHAEAKDYDQTYTAAQVLAFLLDGASAEEGQVVTRLRRFAREAASGSLDAARWEQLLHERAQGPLPAILTLLVREAAEIFVQQPKELGLQPKKDELDVAGSMLFFVNMYKYVARTLGLPSPRLFRPGEPGARLQLLPLAPPALVAGEELFQERPKKELWFTIGKAMAFLRPELTLARLMPHDQLDAVFQAAASLGTSRFVVTADQHLVEKLKRRLEKVLPDQARTQKLKLLARAYCDVQHPGDVRAYMDAAELTSNRVGALLAGDLDVVRRMVVAEKAAVSKLKDETRLRDLVLFCTSEAYGALRRDLGLSVVVPAAAG